MTFSAVNFKYQEEVETLFEILAAATQGISTSSPTTALPRQHRPHFLPAIRGESAAAPPTPE